MSSFDLAVFFALPVLQAQFPVAFRSGARWTRIQARCDTCGELVPDDMLRGEVSRPFRDVAIIDALALCRPCNLITTVKYRLHADMSMTGRDKNGEWQRWVREQSWLSRLRRWLFP